MQFLKKEKIYSVLLSLFMICTFLVSAKEKAQARGFGIKAGWAMMQDDYKSAEFDDTHSLGIYFDMGNFIFNNLIFKPGLDLVTLTNNDTNVEIDIWGIHLDWYWNFMGKGSISPFLGFGAALNLYDDNDDNSGNDDSDAGLELFGGIDIGLTGSLSLSVEGRYCFNDIANRDQNIAKILVGIIFRF